MITDLSQMMMFKNVASGGGGADPYWSNVRLLLNGNGAQGTAISDSSSYNNTITSNVVRIYNDEVAPKFGSGSVYSSGGVDLGTTNALIASGVIPNLGTQDFTIEFFIKLAVSQARHTIICSLEDLANTENKLCLWIRDTNTLQLFTLGSSIVAVSVAIVQSTWIGVWKHVAVKRAGNTFTLWIDGALVSTATNALSFVFGTKPISIAARDSGQSAGNPLNGRLDAFRYTLGVARDIVVPTEEYPTS